MLDPTLKLSKLVKMLNTSPVYSTPMTQPNKENN
jgi:hypothetical protein